MDREQIEVLGLSGSTSVQGSDLLCLIDPEAHRNVNGSITLTRRTMRALYEYSSSLPTGTRGGKVWKRRDRRTGHWMLGRFGDPFPKGHEWEGQIPIGWYPILIRGQEHGFPREVRVPSAPMRGRPRSFEPIPAKLELPEGLFEDKRGRIWFTCLSCGNSTDLPCEIDEFDAEMAYCGGSPRCLP